MKKEKLKTWLLKHCVVEGNLDLSGLDFNDFEGIVDISNMKVKHSLIQNEQIVGGDLNQDNQTSGRNIYQMQNKAEKDIVQNYQKAGRNILQTYQNAKENIFSCEPQIKTSESFWGSQKLNELEEAKNSIEELLYSLLKNKRIGEKDFDSVCINLEKTLEPVETLLKDRITVERETL